MSDLNVTQSTAATPTVDPTPTPATMGTPTQPAAPATAPPAQTVTPPAATSGAPAENLVPSYRLRETREAVLREAQRFIEAREAEYQTRLQEMEQKVRALAGFGPQPDPEVEGVRDQFGRLYPGLSKLEERAEAILQALEQMQGVTAHTDHYWTNYGNMAINKLFSLAESDYGQPLSDGQKSMLYRQFVGLLSSDPNLANAYANDPTFVDQYWREFSSGFVEPARRLSAAAAQGRAGTPVPQDTPGGVPRTAPTPKPADLDERISSAWDGYRSTARQR